MSEKIPIADKNHLIHFILEYLAGNMAQPSEIKFDFKQEYSYLDSEFDQLVDELVEFA